MRRLKVAVAYKVDEGVKIPVYKNIPMEMEFIQIYRIMEHMVSRLTRPELMLTLFLCRKGGETGIVYNNKKTREEFLGYVKTKSMGRLSYKTQTIHQAYSSLKGYGVLVSCDDMEGAYWVNPAFVYDGSQSNRDRIAVSIDRQEFQKDMIEQKGVYEKIKS